MCMAYLCVRRLVDRGCKLVGHGLVKDFRIIDIVVPPKQVIDTVELYSLEALYIIVLFLFYYFDFIFRDSGRFR